MEPMLVATCAAPAHLIACGADHGVGGAAGAGEAHRRRCSYGSTLSPVSTLCSSLVDLPMAQLRGSWLLVHCPMSLLMHAFQRAVFTLRAVACSVPPSVFLSRRFVHALSVTRSNRAP